MTTKLLSRKSRPASPVTVTIPKKVVANSISRRTTNRSGNRPAEAFFIPAQGDLKEELERRVAEGIRKKRSRGDYVSYGAEDMATDGDEMCECQEQDLAAFRAQEMPITERHFEWLRLVLVEVRKVGVKKRILRGRTETVSEDAQVAMRAVVDARNVLALRAIPNGIPISLFDIRRSCGSPRTLYRATCEVVEASRGVLEDFDSPEYAAQLIDKLEAANNVLGEVAGLRRKGKSGRTMESTRKSVLLRILYDTLQFMSSWGKAMAGGDPEAQRRWRLDKTFPRQERLASTDPSELVKDAVADPPDTTPEA